MYPMILQGGFWPLSAWCCFSLIGAWAGYFSFNADLKKFKFSSAVTQWQINLFFSSAIAVGFLGAYFGHAITVRSIWDPKFAGGYVLYGGVIGGVCYGALFWFFSPWKKQFHLFHLWDMGSLSFAWILAFLRIGCLLEGCCYGTPAHGWPGYLMNEARWNTSVRSFPARLRGIPLHYTLLYESLGLFGIVMMVYLVRYYTQQKKISLPLGVMGWVVWISYGLVRFPLEWIRWDARGGLYGGLSPSQWIAGVSIAIGLYEIRRLYQQRFQQMTTELLEDVDNGISRRK